MSRIVISASMYFSYDGRARPEVGSLTTFEAVMARERTATTRFASWPMFRAWEIVRMGNRLRFFQERRQVGRHVDCIATADAQRIDLATCSDEALEEWSRLEGWEPSVGRELGRKYGEAVQVRYRRIETGEQNLFDLAADTPVQG